MYSYMPFDPWYMFMLSVCAVRRVRVGMPFVCTLALSHTCNLHLASHQSSLGHLDTMAQNRFGAPFRGVAVR